MATITVPTIITQAEYEAAFFAVTRSNADLFLVWSNGKAPIWLGRDEQNWKDFNPYTNKECEVLEEQVADENGTLVWEECFVCSTTANGCNQLDLEDLAKGKISWM